MVTEGSQLNEIFLAAILLKEGDLDDLSRRALASPHNQEK